jgi:hypothetical protein
LGIKGQHATSIPPLRFKYYLDEFQVSFHVDITFISLDVLHNSQGAEINVKLDLERL